MARTPHYASVNKSHLRYITAIKLMNIMPNSSYWMYARIQQNVRAMSTSIERSDTEDPTSKTECRFVERKPKTESSSHHDRHH